MLKKNVNITKITRDKQNLKTSFHEYLHVYTMFMLKKYRMMFAFSLHKPVVQI